MRSNAMQSQAAEDDYPGPETNGNTTKGSTEDEGPASVENGPGQSNSSADFGQDANHAGRRKQSVRGSSRALIAHGSVRTVPHLDRHDI